MGREKPSFSKQSVLLCGSLHAEMKTCPAKRGDEYSSGNKTLGLECEMNFQFSLKAMQAVFKERDKAVNIYV